MAIAILGDYDKLTHIENVRRRICRDLNSRNRLLSPSHQINLTKLFEGAFHFIHNYAYREFRLIETGQDTSILCPKTQGWDALVSIYVKWVFAILYRKLKPKRLVSMSKSDSFSLAKIKSKQIPFLDLKHHIKSEFPQLEIEHINEYDTLISYLDELRNAFRLSQLDEMCFFQCRVRLNQEELRFLGVGMLKNIIVGKVAKISPNEEYSYSFDRFRKFDMTKAEMWRIGAPNERGYKKTKNKRRGNIGFLTKVKPF